MALRTVAGEQLIRFHFRFPQGLKPGTHLDGLAVRINPCPFKNRESVNLPLEFKSIVPELGNMGCKPAVAFLSRGISEIWQIAVPGIDDNGTGRCAGGEGK